MALKLIAAGAILLIAGSILAYKFEKKEIFFCNFALSVCNLALYGFCFTGSILLVVGLLGLVF